MGLKLSGIKIALEYMSELKSDQNGIEILEGDGSGKYRAR